jgi:hypothetical protein
MFFISGFLRTLLLWAMIPLTVFAGRPAMGCTCANGEYRISCAAHIATDHLGRVPPKAALSDKSCCHRKEAGKASDCLDAKPCPSLHGSHGGKNCCTPDSLTAVTVASVAKFTSPLAVMFFDRPIADNGRALAGTIVAQAIEHETGPPGGDLVISLRRLVV